MLRNAQAKDLSYRINHSEAKALIVYGSLTGEFDKLNEEDIPTIEKKLVFVSGHRKGWVSIDSLLEKASELFETVETNRDDRASCLTPLEQLEIPKASSIPIAGHTPICERQRKLVNIEQGDTVWATAGPGWREWYGALSCRRLALAQQDLFITAVLILKRIYPYYRIMKSMSLLYSYRISVNGKG